MEKKILIDNKETTLREFIHANTEQEGQIELEELLSVMNGRKGDMFYVAMVQIKIV